MVLAHVAELAKIGWNTKTDGLLNGVKLTVTTDDPKQVTKLRALGFMGIMVQGGHQQPHHLMMSKGELPIHLAVMNIVGVKPLLAAIRA